MPYLWTKPRRKRAYGILFWGFYLAMTLVLWGVTRESWCSYSAVPPLKNLPVMNGNVGRLTTVIGLQSYLTIDREQVDPSGAVVQGAEPSVRWLWSTRGVLWSGAYTIVGAIIAYVVIRFSVASGCLKGRCDECGYDLTGLESGRCPECGTVVGGLVRVVDGGT